MIQIYNPENTEYEQNGNMTLFPEEATIHVILNGEWTATIEYPIDPEGRWRYIVDNAVIKMPSYPPDSSALAKHRYCAPTVCFIGGFFVLIPMSAS